MMENNTINITSKNLDNAIIKVYYDKIILSSVIISQEYYYLIFSDQTMFEVVHKDLEEDDIFKIILLIEEAKDVMHQISTSEIFKNQ
ncbi:MAG: hypothetical protein ACFFD1_14285 [Candidatus Thorarchaeota archaeon]